MHQLLIEIEPNRKATEQTTLALHVAEMVQRLTKQLFVYDWSVPVVRHSCHGNC